MRSKFSGGEGGIRTHVRAFGPQVDFESTPLRPLRYLSDFSTAENAEKQKNYRNFSLMAHFQIFRALCGKRFFIAFPGRSGAVLPGIPQKEPRRLPRLDG